MRSAARTVSLTEQEASMLLSLACPPPDVEPDSDDDCQPIDEVLTKGQIRDFIAALEERLIRGVADDDQIAACIVVTPRRRR